MPPHVYATSSGAYRGLVSRGRNQSILVSGESGAGKTETVKILMGHIAYIASKEGDKTIDKLLKANPLLESFGNAKTVRNDNSSRFGKFSQLEFDVNSILVGSKCVTYLLEKSRVVAQSSNERNYHILYQLLASSQQNKDGLFLTGKGPADFLFTNGGDTQTTVIEGITDSDRYNLTVEALELLGIGPKLRRLLEQALTGVLYLGEVSFYAEEGHADEAAINHSSTKHEGALLACCELLGVENELFSKATVCRTIDVEGQKLDVPLTIDQALSGRDALAKEIYARLFQWLVLVINFNTSFAVQYVTRGAVGRGGCATISLLDIFGFESFAINRFEQLCINYANEKLQQKFTQDVFKTVQEEYKSEGLNWESIGFQDNADVLELLEGRKGVIAILNEECLVPKGSDSNFLSKIKKECGTLQIFSVSHVHPDEFAIQHFAGKVPI